MATDENEASPFEILSCGSASSFDTIAPIMRATFGRLLLSTAIFVGSMPIGFAQSTAVPGGFTDLPSDHPAFSAVEYLRAKGVLQGYPDNTFKPEKTVNRAEALKIIVAPIVPADILATANTSAYTDVSTEDWFLPYVEAARQLLGVIDGPPKATAFHGSRAVNKAEFLKMLFIANKVSAGEAFNDIRIPMANDVTNPNEWFYPLMRYAVASSMTMSDTAGNLHPGAELTRGQVALLMYRFDMYREGRRTQALLSEAETEILNVLQMIEAEQYTQAGYASARSLIAARGALASRPDEGIVKGAVKTAEGFRALVQAYEAGLRGDLNEVVRLAGDAWHLAEKAKSFSPGLEAVTIQMQEIAKGMADEGRAMLGTPQ